MSRWKTSLLTALTASALLAQTASQRQGVDVRRVGAHLACQCKVCADTVASCAMLECEFCKPARTRIFNMQHAGISDDAIVATFVKEFGPGVYRGEPNSFYWIVPYAALAFGCLGIFWFVRRYYHRSPALAVAGAPPAVDGDAAMDRFRDQIEKETAKFD